jgi:hypothetical protein
MRRPFIRFSRPASLLSSFVLAALLFAPSAFAACTGTSTSATCTSTHATNNLTVTSGVSAAAPQKATVYPSGNVVSGMSGTINTVQVRLNGLTHTAPDNLDMVLVSPDGTAFVFWSDAGGVPGTTGVCPTAPFACSINNFTITVADSGSTLLPDSNPTDPRPLVNNTTYKPANHGGLADVFLDSGVTVSAANSAANSAAGGLNGTATFTNRFGGSGNINGEWRLYIALDSCCAGGASDTGSLTSWDLILTTTVANSATTTSLTSTANPSLFGNNVTINATVTCGGNPVTLGTVSFFQGAQSLASNVALSSSVQA